MIPGWCDQERKWDDINIGDEDYMVCVTRKNGVIEIFLTNLIEIWLEILGNEKILEKCRNLNPLLNVNALNCQQLVANILNDIPKYVTEASVEQIKLQTRVEGRSMKFELNLTKGTAQEFWEIITKPLCFSSMELIRQHKILLDLIKKKDEEIFEYKAEGAELIRKHIETKAFDEDQFKIDFPVPKFADCAKTFQNMITFYNKLDLHKSDETSSKNARCVSYKNEKVEGTEQPDESTDINNVNPVEVKAGTSKNRKNRKSNINTTINKKKPIITTYKPIKRSKLGLNNFL